MLWLLCVNILLVTVMFAHIVDIDRQLRKKIAMSTQETIDAVVSQLAKAKGEIVSKIADLQIQLDDANVADVVDVSELVAAAQALDDIVPDPVDVPADLPAEVEGEPETE